MKKEEARMSILREWSAQVDKSNPAAFAMRMAEAYRFRCSGDRYQVVMGWLRYHADVKD